MTLRELYDHYAQFQPDALDAELVLESAHGDPLSRTVLGHTYQAFVHRIYLEAAEETTEDEY